METGLLILRLECSLQLDLLAVYHHVRFGPAWRVDDLLLAMRSQALPAVDRRRISSVQVELHLRLRLVSLLCLVHIYPRLLHDTGVLIRV